MKPASTIWIRRSSNCATPTPRGRFRLLACLACSSVVLPLAALAQTNAPASLPPEAQAVVDKGVLAAKQQDFVLAIRYFQDARKLAPKAPEIYYDLGLAESKIPGRELRAVAWFGAYLAATPNAPNATAVKGEIDRLDVKSQSNNIRLVKSVQEAASTVSNSSRDGNSSASELFNLRYVADLWSKVGDITAALKSVDLMMMWKEGALSDIVGNQAGAGDIAGAQKTADLIESGKSDEAQGHIAQAQAQAGDITGALKTAELMDVTFLKASAQLSIARAQIRAGDFTGALKTANSIQDEKVANFKYKDWALREISQGQAQAGDITGALKTADLIQEASEKTWAQNEIASAQARAGDIAGAKGTFSSAVKIADLIQRAADKSRLQSYIASAQTTAGDIPGALQTADLIQDAGAKGKVQRDIAEARARTGSTINPASTVRPTTTANQPAISAITVSDWLKRLDDSSKYNSCALNTDPFLDLASYLKSLPPSDDPQKVFNNLQRPANELVTAQNVIDNMLKQQAQK